MCLLDLLGGNLEVSVVEMALLTVYFLLLLFSMSPLLHATSHGDLCPEGFYCPAGIDCSSNSTLCEAGICDDTTEENCEQGIVYNSYYSFMWRQRC